MWISAKMLMELMERLIKAENELKAVSSRVEILEKRPMIVESKNDSSEEDLNRKLYDELINGVPDKITGKVKWTDGRE